MFLRAWGVPPAPLRGHAILARLHFPASLWYVLGEGAQAGEDHRALGISARSFPLAEAPDMRMTHVQELEGEM